MARAHRVRSFSKDFLPSRAARNRVARFLDQAPETVATGVATTVKSGLEATIEGLRYANPWEDVKKGFSAAKNIVTNGVSLEKYLHEELPRGKFLGAGNGATLGLYGGLLASGMYVPYKAAQAVLGAGVSLVGQAMTHPSVTRAVGKISPKLRSRLERWSDKETFRKEAAPKIAQASLGLLGNAPVVGGLWVAEGAKNLGDHLRYARWGPVRYVGRTLYDWADRARNACEHYLSFSALQNAISSVTVDDLKQLPDKVQNITQPETYKNLGKDFVYHAGNTVRTVGNGLENVVTTGWNYLQGTFEGTMPNIIEAIRNSNAGTQFYEGIRNGLGKIVEIVAGNGAGEEKYALLIAGYGEGREAFHIADQKHAYASLLKAGFKPENIYVIGPDGGPIDLGSSHARTLAHAYQDTSYSHACTPANIEKVLAKIATRVDSNDTFVCRLYTHGLYDGNHSTFSLNNGSIDMTDCEFARAQVPIKAGAEYHFITTCQSGQHTTHLPPITGSFGTKTGVIAECLPSQNAQAWNPYGGYVFDLIAENGLERNTDLVDLAKQADKNYHQNDRSWNSSRQDPIVYDSSRGGRPLVITTDYGGRQDIEPYEPPKEPRRRFRLESLLNTSYN